MIRRSTLMAFAATVLLAACATTPAPARDPQLSTFNRLAAQSGLDE